MNKDCPKWDGGNGLVDSEPSSGTPCFLPSDIGVFWVLSVLSLQHLWKYMQELQGFCMCFPFWYAVNIDARPNHIMVVERSNSEKKNPATCWWCCKYSDWIVCHPQGPIMVHHFVGWSSRGRSSAPKKLSCSPGSPRWVLSYCWALRGWSDLPIATSYKMLQAFNWRCCTWCLGCPMTPRSVVVGSPSKGQSWTRANCSMSSQGATVITETS